MPHDSVPAVQHGSASAVQHGNKAPEHDRSASEHGRSAPERGRSAPEHDRSAPEHGGGASEPRAAETPPARKGNTERRQRVIDEVKRGIVLGTTGQGQRIVESEITARLDVSRPTAREALNQLARDGYLVQQAYRGLSVTVVDPTRLLEFSRLRVVLDMDAAAMIIEDRSGEAQQSLDQVWERYLGAAGSEDPLVRHEEHLAFHRGFWEASGNYFLPKLWPVVEAEMTLSLAYDQTQRHDSERAVAVHREVVEATRSGELERVRQAMEVHTMDSAREISRVLETERAEGATRTH